MTSAELKRSALDLPTAERQELVVALWQSLESDPQWLPEWQRDLIDERLERTVEDPGVEWSAALSTLSPTDG